MTCGELQQLAAKGQIDSSQCGIIQGFVGQLCGCSDSQSDNVSPSTDAPMTASATSGSASPLLYSLPYLAVAAALALSSLH